MTTIRRDIGERLDMDPNTASAVIRSLERRHLIAWEPHPADGRALALTLTGPGRAASWPERVLT